MSTALSATLTAQLAFDPKHLKYCSTYNLAEGVDESNKKREIYHLGKEYELAVTPKKHQRFQGILARISRVSRKGRKKLESFVDHRAFQQFILLCILTNTFRQELFKIKWVRSDFPKGNVSNYDLPTPKVSPTKCRITICQKKLGNLSLESTYFHFFVQFVKRP